MKTTQSMYSTALNFHDGELEKTLLLALCSEFAASFLVSFSCCLFCLKAPTPAVHYYPHCGYVLSEMVTGLSWLAFILDTP